MAFYFLYSKYTVTKILYSCTLPILNVLVWTFYLLWSCYFFCMVCVPCRHCPLQDWKVYSNADHGILSQIKKNKHHSDCFWELACRSLSFRTLRQDYFICEVALVGTLFINTCTHNLPESKGTWNYNGTREHDLLVKELINAILLISQFYYFCCVTVPASSEFKVDWFKAQKN